MFQLHEVQRQAPLPIRYVAPASLEEAVNLLATHGAEARLVAGGTDVLLELNRGARTGVEVLVDISGIPGLDRINYSDRRVTLGPLVTHADVIASAPMLTAGLPLAQACLEVGSPPLRNRATVVGNVVTASPANDTISALVALNADVTVTSLTGERTVPIGEFITGFRQTDLASDEMVTAIAFDALDGANRSGVFAKLGLRRAQAISVVHVAVVVELRDNDVVDLTVALGSVAPTVVTVPDVAELVLGRGLSEAVDDIAAAAQRAASPIDDLRGSAEYRSHAVGVVVSRAISALALGTEAQCWPHRSPKLVQSQQPQDEPARKPPSSPHSAASTATVLDGPDDRVTATVNGVSRTATGAAGKTLLNWLRDDLGLPGTKEGCAEGECGACTVHLDGAAVFSCLVPAGRADGATITTIEGVTGPTGGLHPFQQAMVDSGGAQCGFCTPGFVMSAVALLDEVATPTDEQIAIGLSGNLCRCTGYCSIIEAVHEAAAQNAPANTEPADTNAEAGDGS